MGEGSDGVLLDVIRTAAGGSVSVAASGAAADGITCLAVAASQWPKGLLAARTEGARLDWIGGTDVEGGVELAAYLFTLRDVVLLLTRIDDGDVAPSAVQVYPGASWHQREIAEMFGLGFADGPTERLLLPESIVGFPLRRNYPLPARLAKPWPGAAGQESRRRRARIPGVHPEWATPPEVAP